MEGFGITGLNSLIAQCADMQKSTEFYRDILGLELISLNPYWTTFKLGGNILALHPPFGPAVVAGGGWTVAVNVDNVKALEGVLIGNGITLTQDFHDIPGGVLIGFKDPDGNLLQAIQSGVTVSELE
jgi:catechol 2,3-dioxygenase-like lactoylglutathione lyase family enzyme